MLQRFAGADHFKILQRAAGVGRQPGDRLGAIEHAAAPHADHQVAGGLARQPRAGLDIIDRWLAGHAAPSPTVF